MNLIDKNRTIGSISTVTFVLVFLYIWKIKNISFKNITDWFNSWTFFFTPEWIKNQIIVKLGIKTVVKPAKKTVAKKQNKVLSKMNPNKKNDTLKNIGSCGCGSSQDIEEAKDDSMISKQHGETLVSSGYRLCGSHSAVKLCRWTKTQLRGNGGCYKHTFYGIESSSCMEVTPCLACANKCVFCWRHHKNPVSKEFNWKMDDPQSILEAFVTNHKALINGFKNDVPEDVWAEASAIRHCALSLVGEPIMYPKINELLAAMHARGTSTFLVTNGQFPEQIKELKHVTQLYLSIDAATKENLRALDRPLFADFWERYLLAMDLLSLCPQRTVFRLTLVKQFGPNMGNMHDLYNYAQLVARGKPDFIELKGVTYCGSGNSGLDESEVDATLQMTLRNCPFFHEVDEFANDMAQELLKHGLEYEIAAAHKHSVSVLLVNKRFFINGVWHTWINYDKFHELVALDEPYDALDYSMPTPPWALYGSPEQGFDPSQTAKFRNRQKTKVREYRDLPIDQSIPNTALAS